MTVNVVLDAGAFDHLDSGTGRGLRGLVTAQTRQVENALARHRGGQRIRVVPTDEGLAKLVGTILHATVSTSDLIAAAHVVAVCAASDAALVVTGDPGDIVALSAAVPGTRILARDPSSLGAS